LACAGTVYKNIDVSVADVAAVVDVAVVIILVNLARETSSLDRILPKKERRVKSESKQQNF